MHAKVLLEKKNKILGNKINSRSMSQIHCSTLFLATNFNIILSFIIFKRRRIYERKKKLKFAEHIEEAKGENTDIP